MGLAMEVISGRTTNPGAVITALTADTGDSFAVRNFPQGAACWLVQLWALGATAGTVRVRSPRMHDNVQGIRELFAASLPVPLLSSYARELLYAQDTLAFEQSGGAAETDCASMLLYYSDLPGTAARLVSWAEIQGRIEHQMGVNVPITTGATLGDYGGSAAINSSVDQFKANRDYAILGYTTDTSVATVGIKSADFGNLRLGGPGSNNKIETRDWFVETGELLGQPCIPVFNAANKANTLVDVVHTAAAASVNVTLLCALLR